MITLIRNVFTKESRFLEGVSVLSLADNLARALKLSLLKLARPAQFLSSPGVRTPKKISVHKFPARYHRLCLKYSLLNFRNWVTKDGAVTMPSRLKKKVFSHDFWQFEHFKYEERCLFLYILAHEGNVIAIIADVFIDFRPPSVVSLGRTPIWRLHTELCKFPWNVSANNSIVCIPTSHPFRFRSDFFALLFSDLTK